MAAASAEDAHKRYDPPSRSEAEDEEVEIDIRGANATAKSVGGGLWLPQEQSSALEMEADMADLESPSSFKERMRGFLRLPNTAIKETWTRLDIADGLNEQDEYGEVRDGWFWKIVHDVLFGSNTTHGQVAGMVLLLMITTSVVMAVMDSVHAIRQEYGDLIYGFEIFFTVTFSIEYVLRVQCLRHPREYICSVMGLVDISSILPTFITFFLPPARPLADLATLRIFRVIRVFRVLRLVRFVDAARALNENISANKLRVAVFMFSVFSVIVVVGCLMYLIEGEANGFTNIPVSLYWAIVTLTTVGYGDIAPQTVPGRLIAAIVMFSGYGVIACPMVLNTQTEEEALRLQSECIRCFRAFHQQDANFCRHCGTALRVPSAAPLPDPEKKKKKKKRKTINQLASISPSDAAAVGDAGVMSDDGASRDDRTNSSNYNRVRVKDEEESKEEEETGSNSKATSFREVTRAIPTGAEAAL